MFAGPTLNQLREAGHEVALVVTQPDRLGGRGMRPLESAIKLQAIEMHLPVFQPERIRTEEAQARIREIGADVMVVVAYGQVLPASLLNGPRLGTLNIQASIVPRPRCSAPGECSRRRGYPETRGT